MDKLFPDSVEAEDLKLRSKLLMKAVNIIQKKKYKKKEIAELLDISKDRVKLMMTGKLTYFTLIDLNVILNRLGYRIVPTFEKMK